MLARSASQACAAHPQRQLAGPRATAAPISSLPVRAAPPCASSASTSARASPCRQPASRGGGATAPRASSAAAPASTDSVEELFGASTLSAEVADIVTYAVKFCIAAQRYELHSWMLLLGLLRCERSAACDALRSLGLEDIYGAWHEVLWALNVSDGLAPRAFTPRLRWGARAYRIANGAVRFAAWAGEERVHSEDLLMAFAADGMLAELFPDLDLSFDRVKRTLEKQTGVEYKLPGYKGGDTPLGSQDTFL